MFALVTGRHQGKTHLTVRWFLESPERRAVIVTSAAQKELFWRNLLSCARHNLPTHYKSRIVVYGSDDFYSLRGTVIAEFAIEDADQILSSIFGVGRLGLITLTGTLINPISMRYGPSDESEAEDAKPR